jgi:hypothetical protein
VLLHRGIGVKVERCAFFTDWRSFTARLAYRTPGSGSFRVLPSASERTQGIQCVFQRFLFLGGAISVKENFSATRFHGFFSLRDSLRLNASVSFQNGGSIESSPITIQAWGKCRGHNELRISGLKIGLTCCWVVGRGLLFFNSNPNGTKVKQNTEQFIDDLTKLHRMRVAQLASAGVERYGILHSCVLSRVLA